MDLDANGMAFVYRFYGWDAHLTIFKKIVWRSIKRSQMLLIWVYSVP